MTKKFSAPIAAIVILAFSIPAMASAAVPTIQDSTGTPVKTGATIRLTGSGITYTSSTLGAITCSSVTLNGSLSGNDDSNGFTIKNTGEKSPATVDCTNGTNAFTITELTITDLKSTVGGSVSWSYSALIDIGTKLCTYTATNVAGTYATGGNVLTFTEAAGITGGACGTAKLDGKFTVETSTGGALKAVF